MKKNGFKLSKKAKRGLSYVIIPVVMTVLGYGLLFLAGRPVISMASGVAGMVLSDSTPTFKTELGSIYDETAERKKSGSIPMEEIEFPAYETYYARISCNRLDMDVPIYWGDSDVVFRHGAGQYIGSFLPGYGGLVLLGAHDSLYFAPLEDVRKDDIFTIKTNYGEFRYKVTGTKIASDKDSEVFDLAYDEEQLVLYTCYPFGALIGVKNQRFYVFAEKIAGPTIESTIVE